MEESSWLKEAKWRKRNKWWRTPLFRLEVKYLRLKRRWKS